MLNDLRPRKNLGRRASTRLLCLYPTSHLLAHPQKESLDFSNTSTTILTRRLPFQKPQTIAILAKSCPCWTSRLPLPRRDGVFTICSTRQHCSSMLSFSLRYPL